MNRKRWPALPIAIAGLVATLGVAPGVLAANPVVSVSLTVSPTLAVDGADVTWIGKVTPVSGTVTDLWMGMGSHWFQVSYAGGVFSPYIGSCEPVEFCTVDSRTGNPRWIFPTLTGPVTLKYHTRANTGATTGLSIANNGTDCTGECPATATIPIPSAKVKVSYVADTPEIEAGTVLHVTVTGSSTAGPMEGNLQANLSAGLAAPTNLSSGAVYDPPPSHYIGYGVSLNKTANMTFDVAVTAENGSSVSITGKFNPNGKYATTPHTLTIHVGPLPATAPPATPRPATPRPAATARAPSPPPSATASATPSASAISTPSFLPTQAASTPPATQLAVTPSAVAIVEPSMSAPAQQPTAATGANLGAVVVMLLALGGGAALLWIGVMRPRLLGRRR